MSTKAKVLFCLSLFVSIVLSAIITKDGIISSLIPAKNNYTKQFGGDLTRSAKVLELPCYQTVTAEYGVEYLIRSPNFPQGTTRGGDKCLWSIRIPPHSRLQVVTEFLEIPCESGHSLIFDYGRPQKLCPDYGGGGSYPLSGIPLVFSNSKSHSRLFSVRYRSQIGSEKARGFLFRLELVPNKVKPNPERPPCGTKITKKIVGGSVVKAEDYPWKVYLLTLSNFGLSSCGATLITDDWLMTAAHCVEKAWMVYAFMGCEDTENLFECDQIFSIFDLRDIKVHENWSDLNVGSGNDIALLRLSSRAALTDRTRLICLPNVPHPKDLTQIQAAGWGATCDECSGSLELMQTTMQVLNTSDCHDAWSAGDDYQLSDKILCTTNVTGHVYFGDSGGFGGWRRPDGRYEQLGIVSFGPEGEYTQIPIVFTSVYDYMIWIYQTLYPFNQ